MANGAPSGDSRSWYVELYKTVGCPVMVALLLIAWDAGWLPSASREAVPILREIRHEAYEGRRVQDEFKDSLLAEIRAIRRRQAALCLTVLSSFTLSPKDHEAIRNACVGEALQGYP